MARPPFPFPPLPDGEVTPWPGPGDQQELLQRDVRIVRWFIEKAGWTSRGVKPDSTLGQMLAACEKIDLNTPGQSSVESIERESARHLMHAFAGLTRLAWAIRGLHGNGGCVDLVHAKFIDAELLGEDQQGVARQLPGGIGTIVFAARLAQAGRGRIVSINGDRGVGHDIKWVTGAGDTVYVERKDRAYEAGLLDTPEKRIAKVIRDTREVGITMPRERGAARILTVGFQHLVRKREARLVDRGYQEALRRELSRGRVRGSDLPNIVIPEHLGLDPKTGGDKFDFFSPQPLYMKPRELMRRVLALVAKALGVRR